METILCFLEKDRNGQERVATEMKFTDELVTKLNLQVGAPIEIQNQNFNIVSIQKSNDNPNRTHVFLEPVVYH